MPAEAPSTIPALIGHVHGAEPHFVYRSDVPAAVMETAGLRLHEGNGVMIRAMYRVHEGHNVF
ncbi:hypothetical protein D3C84_1096680 [compost metagenome]